jgi:hypothetical protein
VKDVEYADAEHFMAQAYFELKKLRRGQAASSRRPTRWATRFLALREKLKRVGKY